MKVSVSRNKSEKHQNYTWGFALEEIKRFSSLEGLGFSACEYSEGHRKNDNVMSLGKLGYIDLDDSVGGDEGIVEFCKKHGFGLSRSASNRIGRYRLLYQRDYVIERGGERVKWWDMDMHSFKADERADVVTHLLKLELEYFKGVLPEDYRESVDVTSARASMHSKEIGEMLVDMELDVLSVIPIVIYNFDSVKYKTNSITGVISVCDYGSDLEVSAEYYDGKEYLKVRKGNIFKGLVNGKVEEVTIGEALRLKCHISDPLAESKINTGMRCSDSDAYMPFVVRFDRYERVLSIAAFGQHNRNHETKSRVVVTFARWNESAKWQEEFVSEIDVNGVRVLIEEKNKVYRKVSDIEAIEKLEAKAKVGV